MPDTMETQAGKLRRGWTTGACATAATRAAYEALLTGHFPDPVTITLPKGEQPAFALAVEGKGEGWARAGIVKDAGDDPDVTHGALILVQVSHGEPGSGLVFRAGEGVGTVTKPGLPVAPGEPAINPTPRRMMHSVIGELAARHGHSGDVEVEITIPGGEKLAEKTWNPRLGIVGGLSILGTTGIVHPFSCSAWIASIHRGIDVARAAGLSHIAGATGSTSESAVQGLYDLPLEALIDMGDFVGGMLKYLRTHPISRVTVAGGVAKLAKMADGAMDLHSGRSQMDFDRLAEHVMRLGATADLAGHIRTANTVMEADAILREAGIDLAADIAARALVAGSAILKSADIALDIVVVDRKGKIVARAG